MMIGFTAKVSDLPLPVETVKQKPESESETSRSCHHPRPRMSSNPYTTCVRSSLDRISIDDGKRLLCAVRKWHELLPAASGVEIHLDPHDHSKQHMKPSFSPRAKVFLRFSKDIRGHLLIVPYDHI